MTHTLTIFFLQFDHVVALAEGALDFPTFQVNITFSPFGGPADMTVHAECLVTV